MDKNTPEKNKFILKRNVVMSPEMECSVAIEKLSASGIRVLLRFLKKRTWSKVKKETVYKNDGLVFTYPEAVSMGIGNTTFYDVIKQLVEVGFIDIGHQGGANDKDCSIYAVSERWRDYGTENFKKVEKKRSLPSGMDVRSHMSRKKLLQETVVDSYRKP